jgi:hypothetical protein
MATQQQLHPIIRPPERPVPGGPVRDDDRLGAHEDLDRQPDGAPHSTVAMTFAFTIMLAVLVAFMFIAGGTVTKLAAVLLPIVAIPAIVAGLHRQAERQRDHLHPSR